MEEMKKWARKVEKRGRSFIDISDDVVVRFNRQNQITTSFTMAVTNETKQIIELANVNIDLETISFQDDDKNYVQIQPGEILDLKFNVKRFTDEIYTFAKILFHFTGNTITRSVKIIYDPCAYVRKHHIRYDQHEIPRVYLDIMKSIQTDDERMSALDALIPSPVDLDYGTYNQYFHGLLHLEEIGLLRSFQVYNRTKAYFQKVNDNFTLEMENLFETRPSLSVGDTVAAWKCFSHNAVVYEGIIIQTKDEEVIIKFVDSFSETFNHEGYNVKFFFNRISFMRGHRAIDLAMEMFDANFFFPKKLMESDDLQLDVILNESYELQMNKSARKLAWFNDKLNEYQRVAIKQILRSECTTMPYIIYGPPGTGKTTTLTELALQLLVNFENSRILITAQSNSAANLIAQRLLESGAVDPSQLVRLVSLSYARTDKIPDNLIECSATILRTNADDRYAKSNAALKIKTMPDVDFLRDYRLVIGTTASISILAESLKINYSFTHAIIDEAGQCTEIDALVPMLLVGTIGQTIMAGDPMQMPPIVFDKYARERGLTKSLLSRMLDNYSRLNDALQDLDQNECFDPRLVTKLLYNYRSLPCILDFVNEQFYHSDLLPMISPTTSSEAKKLNFLLELQVVPPNAGNHGIYFFNVLKGDNKKLGTTSWCNLEEASEIENIVKVLVDSGIAQTDIGVISPYYLQVRLLRDFINKKMELKDITIGTVEEFQGQERLIIILSTVRTCRVNASLDVSRLLGFVRCPKRLNVAVSRARALFMVYGKANVLATDDNWQALIDNCRANKTFIYV